MRRFLLILTVFSVSAWSQQPAPAPPPIVVQVQMPPTQHRDFLGYLQSLGPVIAACVAVGVGLMQRHLQKQHLKQQMFAKRFEVYSAVRRFVSAVIKIQGTVEVKEVENFLSETKPAKFLFGSEVNTFISEIERSIRPEIHHVMGQYEIVQYVSPTDTDITGDPLRTLTDWGRRVEVVFGPYLDLQPATLPWYARLELHMERLADSNEQRLKSRYEPPSV
jgi:hypothetical protein